MADDVSSYDAAADFGALYDAIPAYGARTDVAFYLEEAARSGASSRVLELGCGTGRLTLPLARAGHEVTGIDLSPAMLARGREKLAAEPQSVRERVTLLEGDARRIALAEKPSFDLVVAPFRVLQHFTAIPDQLEVLDGARRHLRPGGRLVFDVFNPSYASMTRDRSAEVEDTPEQSLPDGRTLRRTVRVTAVHWVEQVSDVELIYHVRTGDRTERVVQSFGMRWYTAAELTHVVARAGFRLEALYGGFDRPALDDSAPEIVVVGSVP
ncbi:MAG: class I SAM-dependent methyltransferase [Gemmatimonadetes bacterium]|nr:MAG: class I SAM-dependent methyltransferase [Gemmatimonadota bacterium]